MLNRRTNWLCEWNLFSTWAYRVKDSFWLTVLVAWKSKIRTSGSPSRKLLKGRARWGPYQGKTYRGCGYGRQDVHSVLIGSRWILWDLGRCFCSLSNTVYRLIQCGHGHCQGWVSRCTWGLSMTEAWLSACANLSDLWVGDTLQGVLLFTQAENLSHANASASLQLYIFPSGG